MKLIKLTGADQCTRNGTKWGPGISHSGTGEGALCGPGWIHAYEAPDGQQREALFLALLLNPIHANFQPPLAWEAEGEIGVRDGQLKCGCRTLTTTRQLQIPAITVEQRVEFAIRCALALPGQPVGWRRWAEAWLDGTDRTAEAAARAEAAERAAAAWAARAERAARAARAAKRAAAEAAAWAAERAADLFAIIRQVWPRQ